MEDNQEIRKEIRKVLNELGRSYFQNIQGFGGQTDSGHYNNPKQSASTSGSGRLKEFISANVQKNKNLKTVTDNLYNAVNAFYNEIKIIKGTMGSNAKADFDNFIKDYENFNTYPIKTNRIS